MSWVIVNKQTGKAVCETFRRNVAEEINTANYQVLEAGEYLGRLNEAIRNGCQAIRLNP